jgi:hypothetical protein
MTHNGDGFCEIIRDKPIEDIEDILEIKRAIEKDKNLKEVVIINFIKLKRPSETRDVVLGADE